MTLVCELWPFAILQEATNIIIIKELSILTIFEANFLQFESRLFPKLIVLVIDLLTDHEHVLKNLLYFRF